MTLSTRARVLPRPNNSTTIPVSFGGCNMAAKLALEGTFAFRLVGFDRADTHACAVAGVGIVKLTLDPGGKSGTLTGSQFVTNSPMSGQVTNLDNTTYSLTGNFTIDDSGPPILATSNILFAQDGS